MGDTEQSRTQRKKADQELRALGDALAALPPERLSQLGIPAALVSAIEFYQGISSHGARRRQWKTIGALLRDMDREPISAIVQDIQRGDRSRARRHRRIEGWRDELKAGNLALIEDIVASCPAADRQRLGQLARNAMKEAAAGSGVKAARALFRYLDTVEAS